MQQHYFLKKKAYTLIQNTLLLKNANHHLNCSSNIKDY